MADWVKQDCVSNWLALSVDNLAEDADDDNSRVLYWKSCFTSAVTQTKRPWLCKMPTTLLFIVHRQVICGCL